MLSSGIRMLTAVIGVALMATFVIGLAVSISSGFAGVVGGLPFSIIVASVLAMLVYDFYDECVRRRD